MKYVGLNLIATVAFLSGVGLLYGATGALNMADLHGRLAGRGGETPIIASAAFLIFAFASKAALFPLFFWLPASYHTPSFTTSALFAALLTKVGVYALIRVFTLVYRRRGHADPGRAALAARSLTMVGRRPRGAGDDRGAPGARLLDHLLDRLHDPRPRRGDAAGAGRRASSTSSRTCVVKANLFLGAGAARRLTGSELFGRSGGIWRQRPWFSLLFLIPALSLAGVPPFSGLLGQAPARQGDARRRALRPDLRRARRSGSSRSSPWRGSGRRCSGTPHPDGDRRDHRPAAGGDAGAAPGR